MRRSSEHLYTSRDAPFECLLMGPSLDYCLADGPQRLRVLQREMVICDWHWVKRLQLVSEDKYLRVVARCGSRIYLSFRTLAGDFFAAEGHFLAASAPPPGNASLATQYFDPSAPTKFASSQLAWLYANAEAESQAKGETRDKAAIARAESGRWALRGLLP